jgi:hypothetical protein
VFLAIGRELHGSCAVPVEHVHGEQRPASRAKERPPHAARMRERNPMWNPAAKAKACASRRLGEWKPPVQGGNGKPPPVPQQLLACRLGWEMEVPIRSGKKAGSGYCRAYKIDIANRALMIAIEVDGQSHNSLERRAQDRKKEKLLGELGWTVLRFSNRAVMERLEECAQTVLSTISKLKISTPTPPTGS